MEVENPSPNPTDHRYLNLKMEVEEARTTPSKEALAAKQGGSPDKKSAKKLSTVQRKLDEVTADHQWLLAQYVTVNSQNAEVSCFCSTTA